MPLQPVWDGKAPLTIAMLRSLTYLVAAELGAADAADAAETLTNAADTRSVPAEELLGLREALVRTRPDWAAVGPGTRDLAARALKEAKRLAIEL